MRTISSAYLRALVIALAGMLSQACEARCSRGTALVNGMCIRPTDGASSSSDAATSESEEKVEGVNFDTEHGKSRTPAGPPGSGGTRATLTSAAGSPAAKGSHVQAGTNGTAGTDGTLDRDAASPMQSAIDASSCTSTEEICDGTDNDCDGNIDEELVQECGESSTPPCAMGNQTCNAGAWSECIGAVGKSEDICDGIDNDCDGTPDRGCACTDGETRKCGKEKAPCTPGMQTCVKGQWGECNGGNQGSKESCDGVDNDCNGTIDDGKDALCSRGQHCADQAGCVECTSDASCSAKTDACNVGYCDLSSHRCAARASGDQLCASCPGTGGRCSLILGVGNTNYGLWYRAKLEDKWTSVEGSEGIIDVTIMPDGSLIGVSQSYALLSRDTLTSKWVPVPNSDGVRSVDVLPGGRLVAVGSTDASLWTKSALAAAWVSVPDSKGVRDVAVMPDGTILGVGDTNFALWTRATINSAWVSVPNSDGIQSVDVRDDGVILGVGNTNFALWTRASLGASWVSVGNSDGVQSVAVGSVAR